ncbi:MAG: hypothetical protein ACPIOQ_82590, partial [Promethearchaeia archaeon]
MSVPAFVVISFSLAVIRTSSEFFSACVAAGGEIKEISLLEAEFSTAGAALLSAVTGSSGDASSSPLRPRVTIKAPMAAEA